MATKHQPKKPAPAAKKVAAKKVAEPVKRKSSGAMAGCSGPSKADEARWRAEGDLRTMQQMAELKSDPSRIRAAEAVLKQQLKAIQAAKG